MKQQNRTFISMKSFKFCLIFIAILITQHSHAQKDSTFVFPDSTKVMNDLYFLASDSLQGRKTNTNGNEIARNYIIKRLQKLGVSAYVQDYSQSFTFGKDTIPAVNILGFIEGFTGEDFIVISAHYDHVGMKGSTEIFNGADDNASGVTALLSLAEYFRKTSLKTTCYLPFLMQRKWDCKVQNTLCSQWS